MVNRRRFLKLILGLGTVGAGYRLSRPEQGIPVVALGQASIESNRSYTTGVIAATSTSTSTTVLEVVAPVRLEVIPKQAWGAAPIVGTFTEHTLTRITVHHTGSNFVNNEDAPRRLRDHQSFHQIERGWPDLAYHFIIDRNGHIYEGRPVWAVGDTNTDYDPTGHFLVCCEGEFGSQLPSESQLAVTAGLMAWCSREYAVGLDTVQGHRDVASTSCPGDALYAQLDSLIARARLLESGSGVELVTLDGPSGLALVADIEAGRV